MVERQPAEHVAGSVEEQRRDVHERQCRPAVQRQQ